MKDWMLTSFYFNLFLFLTFATIVGFASGFADMGIIDLEYLNNEIENDNWYVIGGVGIVFLVLPIWVAHILTVYKMEQIRKKVE